MPRLHINICLSDIPKDLIRYAGNGKAYINLNISELRQPDDRGNDHTISVFVPQERREDYPDKVYIGRGKEIVPDEQQHIGGHDFKRAANNTTPGDLPF